MFGIIDRFEEIYAVVELYNGEMINIKRIQLPLEAKEGDVINISQEITIDLEETKKRRQSIEKLEEDLWN